MPRPSPRLSASQQPRTLLLVCSLTLALASALSGPLGATLSPDAEVRIDDVQHCLATSLSRRVLCNVSSLQCHLNQKDCLSVDIPPNTYSYGSIKCCFWCCLQYNAKHAHADISDFIFSPEGLGSPRHVSLTKKSILKKVKFSFFNVKRGSFQTVSTAPQPNAVVMVSTNKAAEYEYQHEEMVSPQALLRKRPWVLRYFSAGAVSPSAHVLQRDHSLGSGTYLLPRGVSAPAAADKWLLEGAGARNAVTPGRRVDILCLVDNVAGGTDMNAQGWAVGRDWGCQQLPQNVTEYYHLLQSARFVIVLPQATEKDMMRSLNVAHPHWVYDAMLCGSVPILGPWIADTVVRFLTLWSAPVLPIAEDDWRSLAKRRVIPSSQFIQDKYDKYAGAKTLSISVLFFPFWLDKLADVSHIGAVAPSSLLTERSQGAGKPSLRQGSRGSSPSLQQQQQQQRQHKPVFALSNAHPTRFECSPALWRPHSDTRTAYEVEIVIPRCCEALSSIEWLQALLRTNKQFKATIYYRCPFCLPQSEAAVWLHAINADAIFRNTVFKAGGGVIVDDLDGADGVGERVRSIPLFDTRSNGKEFVPYIHHVLYNYNSLADFTVFLHTTPFDHIKSSPIFERSMNYLAKCKPDGAATEAFWFVNQRMFEGNFWSNCHGCTECLYHYWISFIDANITMSDFKALPKRSYNAAQFVVSKKTALSRSEHWWGRLLSVTNSSQQDLSKCPLPKRWNDSGNKAGLALERMWHVIFGRPPLLPFRKDDTALPLALRIE